jgi:hypothetical protein
MPEPLINMQLTTALFQLLNLIKFQMKMVLLFWLQLKPMVILFTPLLNAQITMGPSYQATELTILKKNSIMSLNPSNSKE